MFRDQRVQPADALESLGQSCAGQPTPVVVEKLDVVVSPAQSSATQIILASSVDTVLLAAARRRRQRSNSQVLTTPHHGTGHVIPSAVSSPTTNGRTVCRKTSQGQMSGVLTRRPLPEPSCTSRLTEPIR